MEKKKLFFDNKAVTLRAKKHTAMDSYSEIFIEESRKSEHFTDFTDVACKGYNTLCKAKRHGRWWMLKGLKESYRQDETYKNLLQKEFDILISLQHPYIASAYSIEEIPGRGTCIVMEWIDGITLKEWNGENQQSQAEGKSTAEGEAIFLQLLNAVNYIHAKQIVHRDLKPSNVMVTHNGNHVKLIDFGLSDADSYAILKQPAGTQGYISPEQANSRQADIRNDIYSLGCILEKMQLGKAYTPVIKRCKAPIDKRYAGVDEVMADFMARKDGRYRHIRQYTFIALACAIGMGYLGYSSFYKKENRTETDTVYIREPKNSEAVMPQAVASSQQQTDTKIQQPTLQEQVDEVILKGKKALDKIWQESGFDNAQTYDAKDAALSVFNTKSSDFIHNVYPKTFSKEVASQKANIVYELLSYNGDKYITPPVAELEQLGIKARVDKLVSKGKETIDELWVKSGVDTAGDMIAKGEAFSQFAEKSSNFITKYPQTIHNIEDVQKTHIFNELSIYTSEKYIKPTLAKLQSTE